MNEQLYIAIILVGVLILGIMWSILRNHIKQLKNKSNNLDNSEDTYTTEQEIIENKWDNAIDLISTIYFKYPIQGNKLQNILFSDNYHTKVNIHGMTENKQHCN